MAGVGGEFKTLISALIAAGAASGSNLIPARSNLELPKTALSASKIHYRRQIVVEAIH